VSEVVELLDCVAHLVTVRDTDGVLVKAIVVAIGEGDVVTVRVRGQLVAAGH